MHFLTERYFTMNDLQLFLVAAFALFIGYRMFRTYLYNKEFKRKIRAKFGTLYIVSLKTSDNKAVALVITKGHNSGYPHNLLIPDRMGLYQITLTDSGELELVEKWEQQCCIPAVGMTVGQKFSNECVQYL